MLTTSILARRPARYAFAIALPLATVALRAALEPILGNGNALTLLYPVVLVVAAAAGLGPALVTTAVATLASAYVLMVPTWSLTMSPGDLLGMALFAAVCVAIAVLTVRLKDALGAAQESAARAEEANARAQESIVRAEESARRAEESAAAADRLLRLREGFSAMLAHEIRTPVTIILGNAKLLRRPGLDAEQRDGIAADIDTEADRLHRLIEDLLILNRGDERLDLPLEPVVLGPLLARAVAAGGTGATIILDAQRGLPLVSAEPTALEQVVRNLLSNAHKYGGDGPIEVDARPAGDHVELAVSDRGPGIPDQDRERVFEVFYRSEGSRRSGMPGAGVGLFVCRRLVEAMGGTIHAESATSGGTRMVVTLRVFEPSADLL